MDANAEKTAQLGQRAEKKAARRAAFIQDIAEAVYTLGVQRQNEIEAKRQLNRAAANAATAAKITASEAAYDAEHPIEAAYYKESPRARTRLSIHFSKAQSALFWAIERGIFPEGTREMPGIEAQFLALANWRTSSAS